MRCLAVCMAPSTDALAYDCIKKLCRDMADCAEAHHHFAVCGEKARDGDHDGIPCENVCGETLSEYARRLRGAVVEDDTPQSAVIDDTSQNSPPTQ